MTSLLRRLFRAVPGSRARLVLAVLLAAAASGASVALLGVSAWLLSRAAELPPIMYLNVAVVGVRFFGIARGAFRYAERLVGHDLALRLQSTLRLETYRSLARTTLLGRRRGDLLARLVGDVEAVQDLVVRVVLPAASASLVILGTTALLGRFSVASALLLLVSAVLAGVVVPVIAQRASRAADLAAVPARGRLADRVHELNRCATDLTAYDADADARDRLLAVDAELRGLEARAAWVRGVATGAQLLAAGIAVVGAVAMGGQAVAAGALKPRLVAVLALTPLALHEVLADLTRAAQTYTRTRAALARVAEVVAEPPLGTGDRPADAAPAGRPALALRGLTAGWPGQQPVVRGLDLAIAPGERVGLTGPSGVGKTTVAATALGLIPPLAGEVAVAGRLGYLAQDAHIFATSLAENVRIGNRDATDEEVRAALARAGLDLDPARVVGESGATLSGGEQRRLALARLLVGRFDVWILDEPTEHLDEETAAALMRDTWAQAGDAPCLVISHDPAALAACRRVVALGPVAPGAVR